VGDFFHGLFASGYVFRGGCYNWQPSLVWLHGISDTLIALAYYSIPVALYYFVRKQPKAKHRGLILMFAAFVLACGTTHLLMVWNIWHSAYRIEGILKALTAAISIATAIVAIRLVPAALRLTTSEQLEEIHAALVASQDKLHSFFEAAPQGILGVSNDGRISLVNHSMEEMFGYPRAELIGRELEVLLPERYRGNHVAHRAGYFAAPRMRAMGAGLELAGRRKDGSEFPIEIGLSHVNTPDGPVAFGMVTDISERRKASDDIERANEELSRTNIELAQFAHVASHDLQEPLRMVTSYLGLVERRYAASLDDQGREFIAFAVDGALRMKALITDLLEFSRAGTHPASFRPIDAASVIEHVLTNLKVAVDDSGAVVTVESLPTVVADPVQLTQVFQNLIANAIKFQSHRHPVVHIAAEQRDREWIFSVRDNGIGMEARHLDRIFMMFERLNSTETYAGSGMGLAIARKIVERHGGKIWVESQPGAGSTFRFSIPAGMGAANSLVLGASP
jgi:PAS domain S-box-containing protein